MKTAIVLGLSVLCIPTLSRAVEFSCVVESQKIFFNNEVRNVHDYNLDVKVSSTAESTVIRGHGADLNFELRSKQDGDIVSTTDKSDSRFYSLSNQTKSVYRSITIDRKTGSIMYLGTWTPPSVVISESANGSCKQVKEN